MEEEEQDDVVTQTPQSSAVSPPARILLPWRSGLTGKTLCFQAVLNILLDLFNSALGRSDLY